MKRLCRKIAPVMVVIAATVPAAACGAARQQIPPGTDRGALIVRLGPDTLFVERFELTPGRMYVESVVRAPAAAFRTIDAKLNPDGTLSSIAVATFDPASPRAGIARDSATVTFSADSTIYSLGLGAAKQFLRLPDRADVVISLPGNLWFPNYVLLALRAPRVVGDSIVGTMSMRLGAYPLVVKRVARDTVTLWSQISGVMRVILGPDGRLAALDGTGSSLGYVGTRIDWIDIDSVSRAFAARERAAGVVGSLSGRDTVLAELAGARLTIDYGRPTKRGRTIFGNVVPWNTVWRTGANLATHFTTSRDLQFGAAVVPAGTYTLHTIPSPDSWTLLVSRQTGQWGSSAVDPAMVIARIPMRVRESSEVVETFTIALVPEGGGGRIRLAWDRTLAEAGFTIR
ncbi:MAG: DUF2911 domain-containing protein [Gemmatimonadaceae bacterium]